MKTNCWVTFFSASLDKVFNDLELRCFISFSLARRQVSRGDSKNYMWKAN